MRSLFELLDDAGGRRFLADNDLLTDEQDFVSRLESPIEGSLNELVGLPEGSSLVHIGQQVCSDYAPWTLSKFTAGARLEDDTDAVPVIIWHDTYQADAERYGMRLVLPAGSKQLGIWLAPRSLGHHEPRFIPVGRPAVEEALKQLRAWVTNTVQSRPKPERTAARLRMDKLAEATLAGNLETLSSTNATIAGFLMEQRLGVAIASTSISSMLEHGVLTHSLDKYLACLDDVIAVFNETVAALTAQDIDPQVRPLNPDYLPLHFSCPQDGQRLRLAHEIDGGHFAVATCPCGTTYRFHLGATTPSLGELAETGRWSADVSLPVHHNDCSSGWIVGRSTALYGLVLNAVIARVLGGRPIPGWIPPDLMTGPQPGSPADSLLVEYLTLSS